MGIYVMNLSMSPVFHVGLKPVFEASFARRYGDRMSTAEIVKMQNREVARSKKWADKNNYPTWENVLITYKAKDGVRHVYSLDVSDKNHLCDGGYVDTVNEIPVGTMKFTGRGRSARKVWTEAV